MLYKKLTCGTHVNVIYVEEHIIELSNWCICASGTISATLAIK